MLALLYEQRFADANEAARLGRQIDDLLADILREHPAVSRQDLLNAIQDRFRVYRINRKRRESPDLPTQLKD